MLALVRGHLQHGADDLPDRFFIIHHKNSLDRHGIRLTTYARLLSIGCNCTRKNGHPTLGTIPEYILNSGVIYSKSTNLGLMLPTCSLARHSRDGGLSARGQWAAVLGVLFAGLLVYLGFRERYLFHVAKAVRDVAPARPGSDGRHRPGMGNHGRRHWTRSYLFLRLCCFRRRRFIYGSTPVAVWIGILGSLDLVRGGCTGDLVPIFVSPAAMFSDPVPRHRLDCSGAAGPVCNRAHEVGLWLFGLALLLLRCDTRIGGAELAGAYAFCSEGLLRLSILLVVLDESRVRARRLEVMNAISAVAVEARDSSGLMLTSMKELCRLYGGRLP